MTYDTIIIGGGIVGLSTALQWQQRFPQHRVAVLENEWALPIGAHLCDKLVQMQSTSPDR